MIPPQSLAILPNGLPNSIGNRAITAGDISGAAGGQVSSLQSELARILTELALLPARPDPVLWTWLPTNSGVNNYGASDALRRAHNEITRASGGRGMVVADLDAALAGVTVDGQVQMRAGTTADNIHPNDAGHAELAAAMQQAIRRLTPLMMAMG